MTAAASTRIRFIEVSKGNVRIESEVAGSLRHRPHALQRFAAPLVDGCGKNHPDPLEPCAAVLWPRPGLGRKILFLFEKQFSRSGVAVSNPAPPRTRPAPPGAARPPIDDTRIREIMELAPPSHLLREFPASDVAVNTTYEARAAIHRLLHGADDRLLVVVGPCSIHDYDAAIDYATRLSAVRRELAADLIVVMRVYFEKQ